MTNTLRDKLAEAMATAKMEWDAVATNTLSPYRHQADAAIAVFKDHQLDPDMPAHQLRLHAGELAENEVRVARAAIRWANSRSPVRTAARISYCMNTAYDYWKDKLQAQPHPAEDAKQRGITYKKYEGQAIADRVILYECIYTEGSLPSYMNAD